MDKKLTIACFDVYYYENYANAACVVFSLSENEEKVIAQYSSVIDDVHEYIPGQFYKRELPCLLKVFDEVEEELDIIITDSFVWLEEGKKGLGAYLYESLDKTIPVIGVAKTMFKDCTDYKEVIRGKRAVNPVFVSSAGIELDNAVEIIKKLSGDARIPDVLKKVDELSRKK